MVEDKGEEGEDANVGRHDEGRNAVVAQYLRVSYNWALGGRVVEVEKKRLWSVTYYRNPVTFYGLLEFSTPGGPLGSGPCQGCQITTR